MSTKKRKANKSSIPPGFELVRSYYGIDEYCLKKNGLRILHSYDDSAPVVGVMVTYLVGSKNETIGNTGSTHILEHLMFRGSKKFPAKKGKGLLHMLDMKGAQANASTFLDRTNYYEVVPEEHLEFALELEADRMRNALINEKDLEEELPAVLSEYAMNKNEPERYIDEKIWETAFISHPYHHPTIGYISDIEYTNIEKLKDFYNTFYHTNNAVLTILGNVPKNNALRLVKKYFGKYPRSVHSIPEIYSKEEKQLGIRQIEINKAGSKNVVGLGFKVPEGLHPDTPAILALYSLLGEGKTSRLHRAMVEKKIASSVWTQYMPMHDPSLFTVYAFPSTGKTHEEVKDAILHECRKIVSEGVKKTELSQVVEQTLTDIAFARDGYASKLWALNEAIAIGDWRYYFDLPKKIRKITPHDIKKVARKYFVDDSMTVGFYKAF